MPVSEPKMVDLTQFASVDDAIEKVQPADRYTEIGRLLGGGERDITWLTLFFFAMLARAEGLHQGIAREIEAENPHAVFPLIRAFAESVALLIYVTDHPEYIEALTERPSERGHGTRGRKSIQALLAYASEHAPGMKHVYAELSEATHFGAIAMFTSMKPGSDDEPGTFTWQSKPYWRNDDLPLVAAAQTLELAEAMDHFLRRYAGRHLGAAARKA